MDLCQNHLTCLSGIQALICELMFVVSNSPEMRRVCLLKFSTTEMLMLNTLSIIYIYIYIMVISTWCEQEISYLDTDLQTQNAAPGSDGLRRLYSQPL